MLTLEYKEWTRNEQKAVGEAYNMVLVDRAQRRDDSFLFLTCRH